MGRHGGFGTAGIMSLMVTTRLIASWTCGAHLNQRIISSSTIGIADTTPAPTTVRPISAAISIKASTSEGVM